MTNAYWEAVRDHVNPTGSLWRTPEVGGYDRFRDGSGRPDFERWSREGLLLREAAPRGRCVVKLHRLLWTRPAVEVLLLLSRDAQLPAPADPWPWAWPYASPMHIPTALLPQCQTYERTER